MSVIKLVDTFAYAIGFPLLQVLLMPERDFAGLIRRSRSRIKFLAFSSLSSDSAIDAATQRSSQPSMNQRSPRLPGRNAEATVGTVTNSLVRHFFKGSLATAHHLSKIGCTTLVAFSMPSLSRSSINNA